MKLVLKIFIAFLFAVSSYSQEALDTDGLNNLNNVFLYSLKEYCKTLDSATINTVYVRKESFIGESWPKKIQSFQIKYLDSRKDYKNAIKENNGAVTIVGIGSLQYMNGQFSVGVIPFGATYSRGRTNLANGGAWTMYFEYDPKKGGLFFTGKRLQGI